MIPDHIPDLKRLNLMSHAAWIFDLEKMVDNAGIGKEVILARAALHPWFKVSATLKVGSTQTH